MPGLVLDGAKLVASWPTGFLIPKTVRTPLDTGGGISRPMKSQRPSELSSRPQSRDRFQKTHVQLFELIVTNRVRRVIAPSFQKSVDSV